MKISDNKVVSLFSYVLEGLKELYDIREATNISQILFDHHLNYSRADLVLKADETVSESEILKIHFSLKRLKSGEPLQYVIGEADFYGLRFQVNKSVLIPRPETEELVSWIIEENSKSDARILDIGTGSGCIPISLKSKIEHAEVFASDVSKTALNVAQGNSELNKTEVVFYHNDVLVENLPVSKLDVVVSNPPYIINKERIHMKNQVVNNEPSLALFVPNDEPLLFYKRISELAKEALKENGKIYFEVHEKYAEDVCKVLRADNYSKIECRKDLQGKERMVRATVYKKRKRYL